VAVLLEVPLGADCPAQDQEGKQVEADAQRRPPG
jgi:hypothetical protein